MVDMPKRWYGQEKAGFCVLEFDVFSMPLSWKIMYIF